MKQADIESGGRYVARVAGVKTIVRRVATVRGLRWRDERTGRYCSLTARRCWRPCECWENWRSPTVALSYVASRRWWYDDESDRPIEDEPCEPQPSTRDDTAPSTGNAPDANTSIAASSREPIASVAAVADSSPIADPVAGWFHAEAVAAGRRRIGELAGV